MTQTIREVMTPAPVALVATSTLTEAAQAMRDSNIGDVIVMDKDVVCGIVTDRDITVRAIAEERNPAEVKLADICSRDLITVAPTDSVDEAIRLMREKALRRLPVVDKGTAVGIVSLGDLAVERDSDSALADISSAPPNT